MEVCGATGRDCIERNHAKSFNCSTTCQGVYADVQWIEKKIEEEMKDQEAEKDAETGNVDEEMKKLQKRVAVLEKWMMNGDGERGEELDREKYKTMIAE